MSEFKKGYVDWESIKTTVSDAAERARAHYCTYEEYIEYYENSVAVGDSSLSNYNLRIAIQYLHSSIIYSKRLLINKYCE